jgi:hypothetical protein
VIYTGIDRLLDLEYGPQVDASYIGAPGLGRMCRNRFYIRGQRIFLFTRRVGLAPAGLSWIQLRR